MDHASEARLKNVMPLLAEKIRTMETMLSQEGIEIRVTQGLRTVAEQDALYAQGRSTPGAKVTNSPGGHSYHNFGLAVDCCPSQFSPGKPFSADWHEDHPHWKRMEAVGKSLGLDCGAYWRTFHDAPHFQLTGRFPEGAPNDELRRISESGVQAVWDAVMESYKGV